MKKEQVLQLCFKDSVQMVDRMLAGQAVLEGTGRILLIKPSAKVAALPNHDAPAVSIIKYKNHS